MTTDLERRLRGALHEDAQRARLPNPDRPADRSERYALGPQARPRPGVWLVAAAAVTILIVAGVVLLRAAGDGDDAPVDVVPTTTTAPPWTDTPSTGSIVTTDDVSWPQDVAVPPRPERVPVEQSHTWTDVDPRTGSFLYVDYLFGSRVWVLSADGDVESDFSCPRPDCYRASAFGPGPDELTTLAVDDQQREILQILGWDGTVHDTVDISTAFTPDDEGSPQQAFAGLAWSQDGTRVAVGTEPGDACVPSREGCRAEVWLFDRDGGDPQRVYTASSVVDLAWSPDGGSLAVAAYLAEDDGLTSPQLAALRFESGDVVRTDVLHVYDDLVPAGPEPPPDDPTAFAWSPDGTRLAVTSRGGVSEISAGDGEILARHAGEGRYRGHITYGLAWLPEG